MIKTIWHDPVLSKVTAAIILAFPAWLAGAHFGWWPRLVSSHPVPGWLLLLLVAITVLSLAFLFSRRRMNITKMDVLATPPDKGLTLSFPLKCYVQLRNDSAVCADVSLVEYRPGAVTLKSFVVRCSPIEAAQLGSCRSRS